MRAIKDILLKRKAQKKVFCEKDIFFIFQKTIKEDFGNVGNSKLKADFFKNKTLFVSCESSIWAGELWSNRQKIIRRMNRELGEGVVEKIKTR